MPALDDCVHCGQAVEPDGGPISFGLATGGVLCAACRPGQPHVAPVSARTLDAIRALASPGPSWRDLAADPAALGPVRGTVGAVISHLMGRRPRLLPLV
jgi:DNA repair protein RecO (recombination protein O)